MDPMKDLVDELQVLSSDAPDFKPRELGNASNKWLVRSAFQKYMRRGRVEDALRMGEYLYATDQAQAWNALSTIIIEDIGFGDLDLVTYSTVVNLKSVRDKLEAEMLFAAMILRGCTAPKSRSCCELSLGADLGYKPRENELNKCHDDILEGVLVSHDTVDAYLAAKLLRKRLRGMGTSDLIPVMQIIKSALEADYPAMRAALFSFERTVDSMNLALFPVLMKRQNMTMPEAIEPDVMPPEVTIKSVLSAAFDMHTAAGKSALRAFWSHWKAKRPDLFDYPPPDSDWDSARAIGSLVFIAEGGQVDRRYVGPAWVGMKRFQDMNFAIGYGCPEESWEEMLQLVAGSIDVLNDKRKWAAK
jgi:hypothetical protein